jgi:hypothetical protein
VQETIMTAGKLVLGSALSLLVAGTFGCAEPAAAQSDPAETYAAARARYEAQLSEYNQKKQAYELERSEYDAKIDAYQRALNASPPADVVVVEDPDPDFVVVERNPDTTVVVRDPEPDVVIVDRDDFAQRLIMRDIPSALIRVEDVPNANYDLFNAPVVDAAGIPVGHFRRIETKDPGDLVAVVTLNRSRRTISMLTEHVRLDPDRRIIISDMTARDIDLIPSGFPYG